MASVVLICCAVVNFLAAITSVAIQTIVILYHGDCAYSKMGIGVWNGALLFVTGFYLVKVCRKELKKPVDVEQFAVVIVSLTLMASLVQGGVACGVISQLKNLRFTSDSSETFQAVFNLFPPTTSNGNYDVSSLIDGLQKNLFGWGMDQANSIFKKTMQNLEERICFNLLYSGDFYGTSRIGLESGLLAAGLIGVISQIISLIFLRSKLPKDSLSTQNIKDVPLS